MPSVPSNKSSHLNPEDQNEGASSGDAALDVVF